MGLLVFPPSHSAEKRTRNDPPDPFHGDDILHEVLSHLDPSSLASASCVCRRWRSAAEDQRLWERICTHNWPASASSRPQQLKSVVLALGGFRRLYVLCLRPLLHRPFSPPSPLDDFPTCNPFLPSRTIDAGGRQWSKDEVHLSLSLFSIDCYERLGNRTCGSSSLNNLLCKASSSRMQLEGFSGLYDLGNQVFTER